MENFLQEQVKQIQNVNTFEDYFQRMGYPTMKTEKLNQVLKQAVKNSAEKNYHGGVEAAFPQKEIGSRFSQEVKQEGLSNWLEQELTTGESKDQIMEEETKGSVHTYGQEAQKVFARRYPQLWHISQINPTLKAS